MFKTGCSSDRPESATGRLTPQKRGILYACQDFVSERGSLGGVVVRLPSGLRSAQFACALFELDIAGDGAKSVPDGQKQVAAKKRAKSPEGHACEGAGRSCMDGASRGLAFGAGHLRKTRLRLIGPPLLTSKRRRTCSSFDDRHNVSSKKRSAGTQAAACQALWMIYDRCHTWIGSLAMAGKARRPRTGRQRYIAYRLMSAKPQRCTLHTKNEPRRRFIHASRACQEYRKLEGGSKTETARRPQNKTAKEHYFRKREVAKTDPKMGPPRGPIFVTVQSKI